MYKKLKKIEVNLEFKKKRNLKLITPCCSKLNKDGKFINYKSLRESYGYCHSCGITTLPPTQYEDENGNRFEWCNVEKKFTPSSFQMSHKEVRQLSDKTSFVGKIGGNNVAKPIKFVENEAVERCMQAQQHNNLLSYISKTYGEESKEYVKNLYKLGTNRDGGIIFWNINKQQKVQKAKVIFYDKEGRRSHNKNPKVPYLNKDGYYSCLFGEHLLGLPEFKNKPIVLIESEKTAIICAINFPNFTWLSYGGINGMTNQKMKVLSDKNILIVPDLSENARRITFKKIEELKELNISAKMWDLSDGMSDVELKENGYYNSDLEDFLRVI